MRQETERSDLPQGERKIDFFAGETFFVKASALMEDFAARKEKRAGTKIRRKIKASEYGDKNARPRRNLFINLHPRTAASASLIQQRDRRSDMHWSDSGIRIDEKQDVASRVARTSVPRGRDLSSMDGDNAGTACGSHGYGRVGRTIVDNNDLVRNLSGSNSGVNGRECRW
jgi:hypothetical protein